MRRSAFATALALLASGCSGALGVSPDPTPVTTEAPADPSVTVLGPVQAPRLRPVEDLGADPGTVASADATAGGTTTTLLAPVLESASEDPGIRTAARPGTVALTFDDGPFDGGYTDRILEILDGHGVKVTFFISTYRLPRVAHLVPDIVAAGHSVQTHGDHHDDLTAMTEDEIRAELSRSIDKLVEAGAPRPRCLRPPYGTTNATVDAVAADLGLEVVGWTLNTLDYVLQDPLKVVETTLHHLEVGDNILAHDQWAPVWETALPVLIREIDARGIGFSTICQEPGDSPVVGR